MALTDTSLPTPCMSHPYDNTKSDMVGNNPTTPYKQHQSTHYDDNSKPIYGYNLSSQRYEYYPPHHHEFRNNNGRQPGHSYDIYHSRWHHSYYGEGRLGPDQASPMYQRPPMSTYHTTSKSSPPYLPDDFVPPRHNFANSQDSSQDGPVNVTPTRPCQDQTLEDDGFIWELRESDIVCGRGAPVNWQKGNQFFRNLITDYQTVYLCSKRGDKPKIATEVLERVKLGGGRFVRRVKTSYRGKFGWEEIDEKRAYEKVCQSLREGAPELRRQMLASSTKLQLESLSSDKENRNSSAIHRV